MSKAFSLAGLRVGWIVAPAEVTEQVLIHRDHDTISVGMVNDHFAAMALEHRAALLARSHAITRGNLAALTEWVDTQSRVDWVRPSAGTTAMLRMDIDIPSRVFCVDLVQETGVMLTPGDAFDMEGYVRIGFANDPSILRDGLERLGTYLSKRFG